MNLDGYLKKFTKLRTGISHGHVKPHKPLMMLAILSLIENGKIASNRIDYSPQLLELFKRFFDIVRTKQDVLNPLLPFFYLRSEPDKIKETKSTYRSTAFARTIREIYDYRCAACGLRLHLNGLVIIDAAHLIPFSESQDDDPRNGIALCKNHHWAMDKFLVVPGTDNLWHVSPELDDRIEGCKEIISLNQRKILLPQNAKYYPKAESLSWRHTRILS